MGSPRISRIRKTATVVGATACVLLGARGTSAEDTPASIAPEASSEVPREVELVFPQGTPSWPIAATEALKKQIRKEWVPVASQRYGTLHSGVGVWVDPPLVSGRLGNRVLVPVIQSKRLPITGSLALPGANGPRRAVLLVDASSSANARTYILGPDGQTEVVSVLEAERRALEHLLDSLADDLLEFGLIAFGEGTWPIVPPGTPVETVRTRLQQFRKQHREGEGRTDMVCALWLAREWLEDTPKGVSREIFVLTDGDLPYSGRFLDCSFARRRGGKKAEAACMARQNRTECPARHRFRTSDGVSDMLQLGSFAKRARRELSVYPLLFEPDRPARTHQELAHRTGGELVRVSSVRAIDRVLPALVAGRVNGVFARNERTGEETMNLLTDNGRFEGELPLLPGGNDIELRVESDRGRAALMRFRVQAADGFLRHFLGDLRKRNLELEAREAELLEEAREKRHEDQRRSLEIESEPES